MLVDEQSATSFLSRSLLYNSWDFELVVADSLERECVEEKCSYEEAREVFEDDTQTVILLVTTVSLLWTYLECRMLQLFLNLQMGKISVKFCVIVE